MFSVIERLFSHHNFEPQEIEFKTKFYLIAIIFLIAPFAIVAGAILRFSQGEITQGYVDLAVLVLPLSGLFALYKNKRYYKHVSRLFVVTTFSVVGYGVFFTSIHPLSFPLLMLSILGVFIFFSGRERLYWTIVFYIILVLGFSFTELDLSFKLFIGFIAVSLILLFMLASFERINISDKEYRIELAKETRNELLGKMVSMIAHQWRQPLGFIGAVIGRIKFAASLETLSKEDLEDSIEKVEKGLQELSKTVTTFSSIFTDTSLHEPECLRDILLPLTQMSEADPSINLKILGNLENSVHVNKEEFEYVLSLLINNIEDQFTVLQDKEIIVELIDNEENLEIKIYNSAKQIKKEDFDKLFDPYFSTKSEKNRVGLGLFLVKSLLRKNNTSISLENSDKGVLVTLKYHKVDK